MKQPLVSVFIPSYNYARYIGATIDSILAQSYPNWELIIVDDASTDDSPAVIEHYRRRYPDRIRAVLLESNVGQSQASNIGFGLAKGEFISLIAADDVARPHRLEAGLRLMLDQPKLAAAFSRVAYIDVAGRPLPESEGSFNQNYQDIRWQLLHGNFLCATSAFVKLSVMRELGGLNRNLGFVEDYDLWLRMLDRHEIVRVDDIWVDYRLHGENLSYARNRSEQRLGPLYESVAVAVRAMHRWPTEKLHRFASKPGTPAHRREAAGIQVRLAECCLRLDENFFQQVRDAGALAPALGVSAAYEFVLNALQGDPDNCDAKALLSRIYTAMGDTSRAQGGRSITVGQLSAHGHQDTEPAATALAETAPQDEAPTGDYGRWLSMFALNGVEAREYDRLAANGGLATRFHLAVVVPAGGESDLVATLKSLTGQLHTKVALTVVAHCDAPPGFAGDRLRWVRARSQPWQDASEALVHVEADWVGLVECGARLSESALLFAAEAIGRNPHWQALYSDDDLVSPNGELSAPRLKPDFDLTRLRSSPYTDGLMLMRWDNFAALGGFDGTTGNAANYDLLLRFAERNPSLPVGHLSEPLLHRPAGRNPDTATFLRVCQSHLVRSGIEATVSAGSRSSSWVVRYAASGEDLVSLIVPTRDRLPLLARCLESILEKTAYRRCEIVVVDHGSSSTEATNFMAGLAGLGEARLRVVRQDGPFSLAALMNAGAREARGQYLIFLHDDVAALHPDWLDLMLGHARRPMIGAVSPRLLSSDGRIQHAGIVLGLSGLADLVGTGVALDEPGYCDRYACDQEVAAATSACLLVRRDSFDAIGGFDEVNNPTFLTDVDFCLRLAAAGWRIVWTPQASLLHDGPQRLSEGMRSAPLAAAERASTWDAERNQLLKRWLPELAADHYYNRLHSLQMPAFQLCEDPLLARNALPWKPLPRVFVQPADRQACGQYRLSAPLRALASAGAVQGWDAMDFYSPVEMARIDADVLVLQRPYTDAQFVFLEQAARYGRSLRLFDLDDLITQLPERSIHRGSFPNDLQQRLKRAASLCSRLVVSTEPLATAIKDWHPDIRVVANRLPKDPWLQLAPPRRIGNRPRVGWAGALGHEGDLALMAEVMVSLAKEVDWVFLGRCPATLSGSMKEIHAPVAISDYPAALANLALDVAIAPLEINAFNEAKSSLKLLEYGALGYPVVCSDITPYQGAFPVTRVRNRPLDWIKAIRGLAFDPEYAATEGDRLRNYVRKHWMLEDHLDDWRAAWLP